MLWSVAFGYNRGGMGPEHLKKLESFPGDMDGAPDPWRESAKFVRGGLLETLFQVFIREEVAVGREVTNAFRQHVEVRLEDESVKEVDCANDLVYLA